MADIRINALATTAASTASDDFIAVDGSANGTRKLNAYSPTFGGNLTVSGTGTSSVAGKLQLGATTATGYNTLLESSGITTGRGVYQITSTGAWLIAGIEASAGGTSLSGSTAYASYIGSFTNTPLHLVSNSTIGATLTSGGNLLVGTTTDSSNGKLQLATHTTSAGGIGFGTDVSLYRYDAGRLAMDHIGGTNAQFYVSNSGTIRGLLQAYGTGSQFIVGAYSTGWSTIICSGAGTTALTLDGSQNAEFKGSVLTVPNGSYFSWGNGNVTLLGNSAANTLALSTNGVPALSFDGSQNATFAGNIKTAAPSGGTAATWRLGTVASVSPTSPNRTIEVEIGGTTYYIHAKTTND